MRRTNTWTALPALTLACGMFLSATAWAGGRGGGGGFRGGGGGGFHGGGGIAHSPGFSAPRQMSQPNFSANRQNFSNFQHTGGNQPNHGGNTFNRPTNFSGRMGGNTLNRQNFGNNINANNTRVNNTVYNNRATTFNGGNYSGGARGYYPGYGGAGNWGYRPGAGYHSGWVNGYWNGNWNSSNWNWGSFAAGGLVGGLAGWGFGSTLWNWGYTPYMNPYYTAAPIVVQQPLAVQQVAASPYDYSQPINTTVAPPDGGTADVAVALFDDARTAFKEGDYPRALALTDQTLKALPNDSTAHEFRALCLFAQRAYDPAATSLYAVLSVGPGWDWTTLIGLYADPAVYTAQLRALEALVEKNPSAPQLHFVLGYQYLTQGNTDAAVNQYREVVRLQPGDKLSASLAQAFAPKPDPTSTAVASADPAPPPNPQPDAPAFAAPDASTIGGSWTATPQPEVTIGLTLKPENKFTWGVTQAGKTQSFDGEYTYGDGTITLVQANGPSLVGKLSWTDKNHFGFKIAGGPARDPGLKFAR